MPNATFASLLASFWMPERASTVAGDVDWLFYFIYGLCVFFLVLITTLLIVFVIKFRYRPGQKRSTAAGHNLALEVTWTAIPTIIVVVIFYWGFQGYMKMAIAPPNAYEIQVTGQMWNWSFTYPNGHVDSELHVPLDTPVRLVLTSQDVIHSLFIPAFRIKKDAVPGRYNRFWFRATETGTFDIYCAEYCGTNHSTMLSRVIVHDPNDFQSWLAKAANWENTMTPVQAGKMFYDRRGCAQCHTLDGGSMIGPTFKNLFGEPVALRGGGSVVADENYIRESIFDPGAKVVAGYDNVMPSFKGTLSDKDVTAMIAFLKSLSDKHKNEAFAPTTQPAGGPATNPTAAPAAR